MILEEKLKPLINKAIQDLGFPSIPVELSMPKQKEHGDLSTNAAFLLAKKAGKPPRQVAESIVNKITPLPSWLHKVEVAGAGFINFYIQPKTYFEALSLIYKQGKKYGQSSYGKPKKVILEFVSANPTGPLNVVNARAAAVGDTVANLLAAVGYRVHREYYVNDVGNQIDLFALSLEVRYRQALGQKARLPEEGYHGEYLEDFAKMLVQKKKKQLPLAQLKKIGLKGMIDDQKKSLKDFGVTFDKWLLQSQLLKKKDFYKSLQKLKEADYLYEKEGAHFFRSTQFGDDKDRVVKKKDGEYSYFASDIAYHANKLQRKFDWVIDLFGPDHHGYVARTKAAVQALGWDPDRLTILIVQQVQFVENQVLVKMSKRKGKLIAMDDLLQEVGKDVARYFFLQRSSNSHLDFDLELAKKETLENPVFYIQYAHARIASIFRKAREAKLRMDAKHVSLESLDLSEEKELAKRLLNFPDLVLRAAKDLEPHQIAFYCLELAKLFQFYYSQAKGDSRYRVVDPNNKEKSSAKLYLLKNIQIVLQNALRIMGISAPERME